jgi:hypothetical protein
VTDAEEPTTPPADDDEGQQPIANPVCPDCERCVWDPDRDCGIPDHPHCEKCGHCMGRHGDWVQA